MIEQTADDQYFIKAGVVSPSTCLYPLKRVDLPHRVEDPLKVPKEHLPTGTAFYRLYRNTSEGEETVGPQVFIGTCRARLDPPRGTGRCVEGRVDLHAAAMQYSLMVWSGDLVRDIEKE